MDKIIHKTVFGKLHFYNSTFYNKIFTPIHLHNPNNFYKQSIKRNIWFDNMHGDFTFSYINIGTIQKINFIYTSDIFLQDDSNIIEERFVFGFKNIPIKPYSSHYHKLTLNGQEVEL